MNPYLDSKDLYALFQKHPTIIIDSRAITPGCLFFALKGETFDGNAFAADSLEKGAAFAIIDNPAYTSTHTFLVPNVLESLQELARIHRSNLNIPVIGITGTNGKTTTKELINAVLQSQYHVLATTGNLNNHIGVPLTLLSITRNTEIAIIEMGANHPGEIAFLCDIARPTLGLITNIGKAHLEGFGGFEGVIRTKSELYQFLRSNKGKAFVNGDNPLLMDLSEGIECILYGSNNTFQTQVMSTKSDPFLQVLWSQKGEEITINTWVVGSYNLENVSAALSVATYFQIPKEKVVQAISSYQPSNNRSQEVKTASNRVILDAYNANPSSMKAALMNFAGMKADKKMLILGDMLELGNESGVEHRAVIQLIKDNGFAEVILVGPEFQMVQDSNLVTFRDISSATEWLRQHPVSGYTILVKGSRGIKMEKIMEVL
jgi:UDP-N-acetylmuramoyl-tripeptide--D-alanyl-D-alanine ligase